MQELNPLNPFFSTRVMSACFKIDVNRLVHACTYAFFKKVTDIGSKNVSILFRGISGLWVAFLVFNLLISVITSSIDTCRKLNFSPVVMFLIAYILGCFLYFKITFRGGCEISTRGSVPLYSAYCQICNCIKRNYLEQSHFCHDHQ